MVYCLPSNLESLVPPPSEQRSQPLPWRGSIVVSGLGNSDRNYTQEIFVTAVETDGEKVPHWPATFYVRVNHERPVLRDVQAWVKGCVPPLPICTFMPNRLREPNANTLNQTNFRSLSRILFDNQAVAVAPWGTNVFPGAGIIIYPAQNSSAILVGVLFFVEAFPSFIGVPSPVLSNIVQSSRHAQYQHSIMRVPHYGSPHPHPSLSPRNSDPNSPIDEPTASHRQGPFHYIMSHHGNSLATYPNLGQGSSSAEATGYATYPPTHENPPYQ